MYLKFAVLAVRHNYFPFQKNIGKGGISLDRWICKLCQYVYDPAVGDPDSGVAAGTAFEDLPSDWACPICGATKDQFEKYVE
jgi:rubredoxin